MRKMLFAAVVAALLVPTTASGAGQRLGVVKAETALERSLPSFVAGEDLTDLDRDSVTVDCERASRRVVECEYGFDAVDDGTPVGCEGEAVVRLRGTRVRVSHDDDALDCEELASEEDPVEDEPYEEDVPEEPAEDGEPAAFE